MATESVRTVTLAQSKSRVVIADDQPSARQAIERAKMQVQVARGGILGSAAPRNSSASDAASSSQLKYVERLALREHGRIFFQKVFEIDCFTSAANYVVVHCEARTHRMRSTMNELEAKLDPKQFARIHRCTIINIDYMRDFRPLPHGDYLIRLHNGKELKMSRNYRLQFRNAIAALDKQ
jgi:two-component system LytT family response regulator